MLSNIVKSVFAAGVIAACGSANAASSRVLVEQLNAATVNVESSTSRSINATVSDLRGFYSSLTPQQQRALLTQEGLRNLYSSLSPSQQRILRNTYSSLPTPVRVRLRGIFRDLPVSPA